MHKRDCDVYFGLDSVVESSKLFGHGKVPYRVLKHSPCEGSYVYKVRMMGSDPDIVFVKLLDRNENELSKHQLLIEHEYNILKFLREKCNSDEYGVIEPLECIKSKLALITRAEEGERFDKFLLGIQSFRSFDRSRILGSRLAAGLWLRRLFESTTLSEDDSDFASGLLNEIELGLKIIRSHKNNAEWTSWARTLTRQVSCLVNSIDRSTLKKSLCHGDFIPGNMILGTSGKIVMLDLTDSTTGLIYNDLAKFWQWLDDLGRRRPWYRENEVEQMRAHLLKGFFQYDTPTALMNIFLIKAGIRKICGMVQTPSSTFVGDFLQQRWVGNLMRERRVDYWKRRLSMIAENGWRVGGDG